jgi:hypothetical protein
MFASPRNNQVKLFQKSILELPNSSRFEHWMALLEVRSQVPAGRLDWFVRRGSLVGDSVG